MTNVDLAYASAIELLKLFRARKISPVELLKILIDRSQKLNGKINCLADCYFDEALAKAKAAEQNYMKRGFKPRTLEGVPLLVKDAQRVKDKRTTHGSLIFENNIDDHSDPQIERLENAGAIIFGRTTTPEFCLSGVTHSRMWGITRNPWHLDYGPGGSSGGSGAALAAGFTTLATGTDIAGSIRIPSSACGTVGFKPPHGRNPDGPPSNFDRFNHCGPMTRSVADTALMQTVTSGPHPLDHDSIRARVKLPLKAESLKGWKIAYSLDFGYVEVDAQVRRNTIASLEVFRSLGATVQEVDLGWTQSVDDEIIHWYNTMHFGREVVLHRKANAKLMTDYALKFAEAAERNTSIDDVRKTWERSHAMYQTLGLLLNSPDVFLCPTNNLAAVKADHDPWSKDFTINGRKADAEFGWEMAHQFNMLHNCPVLALPSGHTSQGIPTGIQIVGRTWDDARVFRAGLAYEKALGGWFTSKDKRPAINS
jgi:Asp-tRNA(Asn)/Glu-tRNA(Gln) amidotransferase A subunit family amidase